MNTTEVIELADIIRAAQKALLSVLLMRMSPSSVLYELKRFQEAQEQKFLTFKYLSEGSIKRTELQELAYILDDLAEEWHGWPESEMEAYGQTVYASKQLYAFLKKGAWLHDDLFWSKKYPEDQEEYTFPKYPMIDATET